MAVNIYMYLVTVDARVLSGDFPVAPPPPDPFKRAEITSKTVPTALSSYSFDVEQVLNIGSQSTGAGAGKVTFNPLTIVKRVDSNSATLFNMCCSGTPFKYLDILLVEPGKPSPTAAYGFGLAAVKTISRVGSSDDPMGLETVSFEFGQLSVGYAKQLTTGELDVLHYGGWDRVKNVVIPGA